jgi:hypothetical protein
MLSFGQTYVHACMFWARSHAQEEHEDFAYSRPIDYELLDYMSSDFECTYSNWMMYVVNINL